MALFMEFLLVLYVHGVPVGSLVGVNDQNNDVKSTRHVDVEHSGR